MSYTQKIDVLDLIIQILNEHEKKLSLIADRLEAIVNELNHAEPASEPAAELEEDSKTAPNVDESSKYLEEHR